MTEKEIQTLVEKQRRYFDSGATLDVSFRVRTLKKLKAAILLHTI